MYILLPKCHKYFSDVSSPCPSLILRPFSFEFCPTFPASLLHLQMMNLSYPLVEVFQSWGFYGALLLCQGSDFPWKTSFLTFLLGLKCHSFSCSLCSVLSVYFQGLVYQIRVVGFFNDTASNFLILSSSAKDQMSTLSCLRHCLNTVSTQLLR